MSRLVDHAAKQLEGLPGRLEDITGQEVTIKSVRWSKGNFGPYCVIEVMTAAGEVLDIMTSAMLVMDALEHAEAESAFPCAAKFERHGRTWVIE